MDICPLVADKWAWILGVNAMNPVVDELMKRKSVRAYEVKEIKTEEEVKNTKAL